jgi:hypothetical protein
MANFIVEISQRTFFRVTADDQDKAEEVALDWATDWSRPDGAVVDGKGGLEIGDVGVESDGRVAWISIDAGEGDDEQ